MLIDQVAILLILCITFSLFTFSKWRYDVVSLISLMLLFITHSLLVSFNFQSNIIIDKLNGYDFNGSKLRVELSEKKDSSNKRNSTSNNKSKKRKNFKKIVHSDAPNLEAPDPRWAGELSKLKDLLANQKTPV